METVAQLLNLPYETLAVLGFGYIGYRLAYVGHDGPHSTIDVVFISLIFAALAKAVMLMHGGSTVLASIPAFAVVCGTALLWRIVIGPRQQKHLREVGLIDHDRGRNVWESMLMRTDLKAPTRLIVYLKNGGRLMCEDLRAYRAAPLGPCLLGPDGSVALYVTDTRKQGINEWSQEAPFDEDFPWFGHDMTFVPAGEIERIAITRPS